MRYRPPLLEEPCAQTLSGKMGAAKYTVKRRIFWRNPVYGGRGCSPSLLRRGSEMAYGKDTASMGPAGPWPDLKAYA